MGGGVVGHTAHWHTHTANRVRKTKNKYFYYLNKKRGGDRARGTET